MKKLIYVFVLLFIASDYFAQNDLNDNSCSTEDCHESIMKKSFIHSPMDDGCSTCHEKNKGEHDIQGGWSIGIRGDIAFWDGLRIGETEADGFGFGGSGSKDL